MKFGSFIHIKRSPARFRYKEGGHGTTGNKIGGTGGGSPRSAPGPKGLFSKDRAFLERHHQRRRKIKHNAVSSV